MDHLTRLIFAYAYFISIPFAFWCGNTDVARGSRYYKSLRLPPKRIPFFTWSEFREYTTVFSIMCGIGISLMPWMNWVFVAWWLATLIWYYVLVPIYKGFGFIMSLELNEIRPFAKK